MNEQQSMRNISENTKLEEYRYLQEEHKKNRGYLFERPLLIIGIVAAVFQYIYQSFAQKPEPLTLLPKLLIFLFLIFVLYYNLIFTRDKLISDSRIVAYIQLFHEDCLVPYWIGWETSLRYYRIWMNIKIQNNSLKEWIENNMDKEAHIPKGLFFYKQIYCVHVFFILFLSFMWITAVCYVNLIVSTILLLIFIYFCYYFLKPTNPLHYSIFENYIEEQRTIWLDVYKEHIIRHFEDQAQVFK